MKNKKKSIIATIAVITAIIGVVVAVGAYLKKKAEDISEKLDFDGDLYYEDDDYFDEEISSAATPNAPVADDIVEDDADVEQNQ